MPDTESEHDTARTGPMLSVGVLHPRFDDINRIAVLRGGGLGDLVFVLAAVDSLAAAYPHARITLLGTPLHRALLSGRPGPVSKVEVLPVIAGVRDVPGAVPDDREADDFVERMRAERFDLAVQVHGGGRFSNPLLLRLGARHTVGMRTPDAAELERSIPYVYYQHEVLRALEVVGLAGAAPALLEPSVAVTDDERRGARERVLPDARGLVVLHPGATDVRRRWPSENFAAVAARLADDGAQVLVVGDDSDVAAASEIVRIVDRPLVSSLAGKLTLSELVGLLSIADVMLGNDSGPRHLAQAVGTPTVGVYWSGNLINAGPLARAWHRAHLSWRTQCPVCGRDTTQVGWTAERCEHELTFVDDVKQDPVYDDAAELMARSLLLRGR